MPGQSRHIEKIAGWAEVVHKTLQATFGNTIPPLRRRTKNRYQIRKNRVASSNEAANIPGQRRQQEAARAERLVAAETVKFQEWLQTLEVYPTIIALKDKAASISQAELKKTLSHWGPLSEEQRQALEWRWEFDFAHSIPGRARFRVNAYFQRGSVGGAFRLIPSAIRNFDDPQHPRQFHFGFIGSSDNHSARPGTGYKEFARREMTEATGARDGFGVHSLAYYRRAYELFAPRGECVLLQAEFSGQVLAALMAFAHGSWAWYFYGASADLERNRMPAYLLQWEAMRWASSRGCLRYDLWGVPDRDEAGLEAAFESCSDGLWGVYRFKRGFGGQVCRTVGAWDRVYIPALYSIYRWWFSRRGR